MSRMDNMKSIKVYYMLLGMIIAFCTPLTPALQAQATEATQNVDELLDIERKIEINKRMLELRKLQLQRQEMEMKAFKSSNGVKDGPLVIDFPEFKLESIYSDNNQLMAGLRYGKRYLNISKGDTIEKGVKVVDINDFNVLLNVHGQKISIGIDHHASSAMQKEEAPAP